MSNLFRNSLVLSPDENRLANALLTVLEHSDRKVLSEFLTLAAGRSVAVTPEDDVRFAHQVPLKNEMPNARISVKYLNVVVEATRNESLDEDRFRKSWRHLHRRKDPTVLLALTGSTEEPAVIDALNQQSRNPYLNVRHLCWSEMLNFVWRLQKAFEPGSVTTFLLGQFEEYLKPFAEDNFAGVKIGTLVRFGQAVREVERHRKTTEKSLEHLLTLISKNIREKNKAVRLNWKIKPEFAPTDQTIFYKRLFAESAELPKVAGYCVLPYLDLPEHFKIGYYFSLWTPGDPHIAEWMLTHQEEIEDECRDIAFFGQHSQSVFHISKELPPERLPPLFAGDRRTIDWVADLMAAFFATMEAFARRASESKAS